MTDKNVITVGSLIGITVTCGVPSDAAIMTDSGWECDATEVNLVYYNAKTKVLMLTREYGNYEQYADSDDWKLLWKHPEVKLESEE